MLPWRLRAPTNHRWKKRWGASWRRPIKPLRVGESTLAVAQNLTILALILIGPIFFAYGLYTQQQQAALARVGVKVPGMIMAGEEIRGRKGRRSYSFSVAYVTQQGQAMLGDFSVNGSFFKAHISGDEIGDDQVEVIYHPDDPNEAMIVGGSSGGGANIFIGLVMTAIGIIGFVVTYFFDFDF